MEKTVEQAVPSRFKDLNTAAFDKGRGLGR